MHRIKIIVQSIIVALLVVSTTASAAASDDGLTFTSPDQRLSFWTPITPRRTLDALPSKTGSPYQRTTYAVEARDYMLLVGILDFRDDLATTGDEDSYLDTMIQSMQAGFGVRFVLDKTNGSTPLSLGSNKIKGRQIRGTIEGTQMIFRAYVMQHSIVMVQVGYPVGNSVAPKVGERFFNSVAVNFK